MTVTTSTCSSVCGTGHLQDVYSKQAKRKAWGQQLEPLPFLFLCFLTSSPLVQLGNCLQTDKLRDQHYGKKRLASTSAEKFSEPEFSDTIQRWKLFYQGLWSFSCLQTPESLSRALVYCHRIACFAKTFASTILLS